MRRNESGETDDIDEETRQFLRIEIRLKTGKSTSGSRIRERDLEAELFLHRVGHIIRISQILLVYTSFVSNAEDEK